MLTLADVRPGLWHLEDQAAAPLLLLRDVVPPSTDTT
jgi:hypothetical protein